MIKASFIYLTAFAILAFGISTIISSCNNTNQTKPVAVDSTVKEQPIAKHVPEYFNLRPEVEKTYGYTHAVRIGDDIKISGAVSMDDKGEPTALGDIGQQMKNAYSDLDKVLKHYGCTFDDVIVENVLTTNMPAFLKVSGYRAQIYKKQFPTGSWLGVRELALPGLMIEIELEVYKPMQ